MKRFEKEGAYYAKVDGTGADIVTTTDWVKVMFDPLRKAPKDVIVQCQIDGTLAFDMVTDCTAFILAPNTNPTGPGLMNPEMGKVLGRSEMQGACLGYIKAPAGYKIVICPFN